MVKFTISPDRPNTTSPGYRRVVGWSQHFTTYWVCLSFLYNFFIITSFLIVLFDTCKLLYSTTSLWERSWCLWSQPLVHYDHFYFCHSMSQVHKRSNWYGTRGKHSKKKLELRGQRTSLTCPATIQTQSLGGCCPATTTWTQSLGGLWTWQFATTTCIESLVDFWWYSFCSATTWTQSLEGHRPATTRNQSLEGLLTLAFVLLPFKLNQWEDAWPSSRRTQSLQGPFVNHSSEQS